MNKQPYLQCCHELLAASLLPLELPLQAIHLQHTRQRSYEYCTQEQHANSVQLCTRSTPPACASIHVQG